MTFESNEVYSGDSAWVVVGSKANKQRVTENWDLSGPIEESHETTMTSHVFASRAWCLCIMGMPESSVKDFGLGRATTIGRESFKSFCSSEGSRGKATKWIVGLQKNQLQTSLSRDSVVQWPLEERALRASSEGLGGKAKKLIVGILGKNVDRK